MPIYYKKVNPNANDGNYAEKGQRFTFGIKRKLSNTRSLSSRSSFDGLELDAMHSPSAADSPLIGGKSGAQSLDDNCRRSDSRDESLADEKVITKYGPILVTKQESNARDGKPVIITYHDIGLNWSSNFESFFSTADNRLLLETFRVYHVTAPGQESEADDLPLNYRFPTMDELADQVLDVCRHYKIGQFVGFAYGAGANVLSRVALAAPELVEGLFLLSPSGAGSSWTEWFYQKLNLRQLLSGEQAVNDRSLPPSVQNYLVWHLFGDLNFPDRVTDDEAVDMYRRYFAGPYVNRRNLALFIEQYVQRTALGVSREDKLNNFKCAVAVVCGQYSPHVDESVAMNGKLMPEDSTWMKLSDGAMVLEEQPLKVAQAFRLFLQGLGYTLKEFEKRRALRNGMSMPCLAGSRLSLYAGAAGARRQTFAVINEV